MATEASTSETNGHIRQETQDILVSNQNNLKPKSPTEKVIAMNATESNIPQTDNPYVKAYLKQATESDTLQLPDPGKAGEHLGFLEAIYQEHQIGRIEGAKEAIKRLTTLLAPDTPEQPARRIYHVSELSEIPDKAYILEPQIPELSVIVIYGLSGSCKTFYGLHCASQISQKVPVLYLASEGKSGYKKRMKALCQHNNLTFDDLQMHFDFESLDVSNEENVRAVIETWKHIKPKVVFIDTLARNMNGDENKTQDMNNFVRGCDLIRDELNTSVVVVHHTSKSGGSERGSVSLRNASDVMISLKNDDGRISVSCNKSKDAPEFETQYFHLQEVQFDDNTSSCVLVPTTRTAQTDTSKLTNAQQDILEMLSLAIFVEHGAKMRDLKDGGLSLAKSTIYRVLSNLKDAGLIRQAKKGDPYYITPKGKEAIGMNDENHEEEDEL